jgi:hydrogenase maturation factor
MIVGVVPDMAEEVLKAIKRDRYGRDAAIIGKPAR